MKAVIREAFDVVPYISEEYFTLWSSYDSNMILCSGASTELSMFLIEHHTCLPRNRYVADCADESGSYPRCSRIKC